MNWDRDVPPEIQEKRALLRQHKLTIEHLRNQCQELEEEINTYLASVAPIKKVPEEILLNTFKYYLVENPRLIRRLLLVCKFWNLIIINAPTLWTRIPIIIDTRDQYAKHVADSISRRIISCLQYSGDLLLQLDIDLAHLHSLKSSAIKKIEKLYPANSLHILDGRNSGATSQRSADPPWHLSHITQLLSLLTGQIMRRWESLKLTRPNQLEGVLKDSLWDALAGPTPSLTSIQIYAPDASLKKGAFSELPSLSRLTVTQPSLLDLFDIRGVTRVKYLEIGIYSREEFHEAALQRFRSLHTLVLWNRLDDLWLSDSSVLLSFPLLQDLSFNGGYGVPVSTKFEAPSLINLRIERSDPRVFCDPPTRIHPKTISWFVLKESEGRWSSDSYYIALRRVLEEYHSSVETLIVPTGLEDDIARVFQDLENEDLSCSQKQVRAVSDWDKMEDREKWNIETW